MSNLILLIISIGLTAIVGFSAVSYIDPDARIASGLETRLSAGFNSLESGYNGYVLKNSAQPNLLSDITPSYAFVPPAIITTASWTFGSGGANGTGRYFCYSGTLTPALMRAAASLRGVLSPQAYFVNSNCGAATNAVPAGATPQAALTYWVSAYQ